ncbi:MAG: cytochrome c [Halobacteria archaeon]
MRARAFLLLGLMLLAVFPLAQAAEAAGGGLPKPEKVPSAERGKVIFEQGARPACKTCHGEKGDGTGAPGAANFHDLARFGTLSDAQLFEVITSGKAGTAMPAFGDLSAQDKWDLIAYIRTTFMYQSAAGGPAPAEGVHLRAYWLGLIGIGAAFLLMGVSFAVIRFTKKR